MKNQGGENGPEDCFSCFKKLLLLERIVASNFGMIPYNWIIKHIVTRLASIAYASDLNESGLCPGVIPPPLTRILCLIAMTKLKDPDGSLAPPAVASVIS